MACDAVYLGQISHINAFDVLLIIYHLFNIGSAHAILPFQCSRVSFKYQLVEQIKPN